MISPTSFHELVSGRRRGAGAALLRAALAAASVPYGWAVAVRNRRFNRGATNAYRPDVPVVSVGNLTVGGTGKTPLVEWIVRRLAEQSCRPVILSRGYRAVDGATNDEGLELELALPGVPHLQNPDRSASAAKAIEELRADVLVLDDGFQHRRLARDLDIVLLDASEPFGFDRLLPRGLLREPAAGLSRAHVVVLSRADMLDAAGREAVRLRAARLCPQGTWCEVRHRAAGLIDPAGQRRPLAELHGQRIAAFCGVGNPAGFRHTLASLGYDVAAWREFPDHHRYTDGDAAELAAWARAAEATAAICTRKDLVKLPADPLGPVPLWALEIDLQFLRGEQEMAAAIARVLAPRKSQGQSDAPGGRAAFSASNGLGFRSPDAPA